MAGGGSEYKKGLWTMEEDRILMEYVRVHGKGHWNRAAKVTGLKRSGKSCRLRWINYLSPSVKRGDFSEEEDDLIIRLHNLLGNRWSLIAGRVPGRTDNQVKNHWNTRLSKKLGVIKKVNFQAGSSTARLPSRFSRESMGPKFHKPSSSKNNVEEEEEEEEAEVSDDPMSCCNGGSGAMDKNEMECDTRNINAAAAVLEINNSATTQAAGSMMMSNYYNRDSFLFSYDHYEPYLSAPTLMELLDDSHDSFWSVF